MDKEEFIKELLDNGYQKFRDNLKNSEALYQKRVSDDEGIKYFLNVYHWNIKKLDPNTPIPHSFHFEVQFYKDQEAKENTVNVSFHGEFIDNEYRPTTTLQDAELFFEGMFDKMKFEYREKY